MKLRNLLTYVAGETKRRNACGGGSRHDIQPLSNLIRPWLADVGAVFGRLDKETCGRLLEPGIDDVAEGLTRHLTAPGGLLEWAKKSGVLACAPRSAVEASRRMVRRHGRELVSAVLGEMQERVPEVWDVKTQVVGAMTRDKKIIVELFQRCGREEFVFIRRSGLVFGFLFGILQMLQWLVWDPWWSLAVGVRGKGQGNPNWKRGEGG